MSGCAFGSAAVAALATVAFCASLHAAPVESSLRFEDVFSDVGEPLALHYGATFQSRGTFHMMEVWRDGAQRLKRLTDGLIETHVTREPGSADYEMTILDASRKLMTRVDRASLYRVGNFTDWFDLAHGLRHPAGAYRLSSGNEPTMSGPSTSAITACHWFDLTQSGRTVHVCWDAMHRLPALLVDEDGATLWRLQFVDDHPAPAGSFDIHDAGFVRNDVGADLDKD